MCGTPMIDMSIEPALTLLAPAAVVEGSAPPAVQWQWFVCGKILLGRGGEGREGKGAERGGNTAAVISIVLDHSSRMFT